MANELTTKEGTRAGSSVTLVRPASTKLKVTGTVLVVASASSLAIWGLGALLPWGFAALGGALLFAGWRRSQRSQSASSAIVPFLQSEEVRKLKSQINKARYLENVGKSGEAVGLLMDEAFEKWKVLEKNLAAKFDRGEITFQRYQTTAEAAFMGIMGNLEIASHLLQQLNVASKGSADGLAKDIGARIDLGRRTLSELDRLGIELAKIETDSAQSSKSLESTLNELSVLAERAHKYSKPNIDSSQGENE